MAETGTVATDDEPLSDGDISVSNVRPAYLASLELGVPEDVIEAATGWRRADLERPGARVTGASTCAHMELMAARDDYPTFVVAAARAHDASSLGVVGLACKTAPSVGAALACHRRFQHLTNRTARYEADIMGADLVLREDRPGPPRLGSLLLSEFTLLVAVRLLSVVVGSAPPVRALRIRRTHIPEPHRAALERAGGGPVVVGADAAALVLDPAVLDAPTVGADPELARYFADVLARAAPRVPGEPQVVAHVRDRIRARLPHGTPSVDEVAGDLGVGARTLQRRLEAHGTGYAPLLDDTRRRAADAYLAQPELTIAEVAYLLGYREQASFFRAFRRWHGETPSARRVRLEG